MCLAQGHKAVAQVRLEPVAPPSPVEHCAPCGTPWNIAHIVLKTSLAILIKFAQECLIWQELLFNPYSANNFIVLKMIYVYCVCCIYSNAFQTALIMDANTMSHDQTAPKSDLSPFNFQFRLQKYKSRRESRRQLLLILGKCINDV